VIEIIIIDPIKGKWTMTIPSKENKVYEVRLGPLTVRERSYSLKYLRHELKKILSWLE